MVLTLLFILGPVFECLHMMILIAVGTAGLSFLFFFLQYDNI